MALPGQTFKRIVVLLLDCGRSMQQPFHLISGGDDGGDGTPSRSLLKQPSFPGHAGKKPQYHGVRTSTVSAAASDAAVGALAGAPETATPLELMQACVIRYLENLAAASARVDICIIAYGSPHTRNHLAPEGEKSEGYLHVEELREPSPVTWKAADVVAQHLKYVKDSKAANRGDWIDAVVVGADVIERAYGPKLVQHEVFFLLFSDFKTPPASEEDLEPVQRHLKKLDVQLIAILASHPYARLPSVLFPATEPLQEQHGVEDSIDPYQQQQHPIEQQQEEGHMQKQQAKRLIYREHRGLISLWNCAAAVVPWRSLCSSTALRFPSLLRTKRLTTKCRIPLRISSSFSLPVFVFLQTKRESLPPLKKRVYFKSRMIPSKGAAGDKAVSGEKRRRGDTGEGGVDWEGEEADTADEYNRRREEEKEGGTGIEKGDSKIKQEQAALRDYGWKDVRIHRFYYRAQDPDRRPVFLDADGIKKELSTSPSSRQKAEGRDETRRGGAAFAHDETDDDDAAVMSKTEMKEGKLDTHQQRQKLLGYRFGRQLVVISALEQQALKQPRRPAAIEVLGVVHQAKIKRWWITGNTEYVTSGLNCLSALLALRALVLALQRLRAAMICSVTWREGQPARPAVLLPHTYFMSAAQSVAAVLDPLSAAHGHPDDTTCSLEAQEEEKEYRRCYGFRLVYLPFAEDMQMLRLPSLRPVSPSQLQAVESFVTHLTFPATVKTAAVPASLSSDSESARKYWTGSARETGEAAEGVEEVYRHEKQQTTEGAPVFALATNDSDSPSCAAALLKRRMSSNSNSSKSSSSVMYASLANPAVEMWDRHYGISSPSPPCSSSVYHTFLPPSISSLSSLREYMDLTCIPSPAQERLCALLVYRHHFPVNPLVSHASKTLETSSMKTHNSSSSSLFSLQRRSFSLLWPPEYSSISFSFHATLPTSSTPESLFSWPVRTQHHGGVEAESAVTVIRTKKLKDEEDTEGSKAMSEVPQEIAKELLFSAFPLGTSATAQQSLRERRAAGKQQLWENVKHKQQLLQAPAERLRLEDVELPHEIRKEQEEAAKGKAAGGKGNATGEKKARVGEEEEAAERAAEAEARKERIALLETKLHVKSINPVGDFNRMLEVKEVDLTDKAIDEMIAVIYRFLEAAKMRDSGKSESLSGPAEREVGQQQLLGKAFACVTALREGCRRELEGMRFNAFLRSIKVAASAEEKQLGAGGFTRLRKEEAGKRAEKAIAAYRQEGGGGIPALQPEDNAAAGDRATEENGRVPASTMCTFYRWLKDAKVALITIIDDPRAGVKPEDSLTIYNEAAMPVEEEEEIPKEDKAAAELNTEEQELLDLIE